MVENQNRYIISDKKFGHVNWLGFFTLYKKEILRFLIVAIQTIISPLVTALISAGALGTEVYVLTKI